MRLATHAPAGRAAAANPRLAAAAALLLGLAVVFTTGFAGSATLHNAAHDTRHAMSFPCH